MSALIEIVPYRTSWVNEFAAIRDRLKSAMGTNALRIEHVGSTSVVGLAAKDVIDIQVSVTSLDSRIRQVLCLAGLRFNPEFNCDHVPPGTS
jgi:GrpB-like predicted nucleotidyltransferase (UPF0157 family)